MLRFVPEADTKAMPYLTFAKMALNSSMLFQISSCVSPSQSETVANSALSCFIRICASATSSFRHFDAIQDIAVEERLKEGEERVFSAAISFCNLRI